MMNVDRPRRRTLVTGPQRAGSKPHKASLAPRGCQTHKVCEAQELLQAIVLAAGCPDRTIQGDSQWYALVPANLLERAVATLDPAKLAARCDEFGGALDDPCEDPDTIF